MHSEWVQVGSRDSLGGSGLSELVSGRSGDNVERPRHDRGTKCVLSCGLSLRERRITIGVAEEEIEFQIEVR